MQPRWHRTLAVCLGVFALAAGPAAAQRDASCFATAPVPDWDAVNLGLAIPGASAPAGDDAFILCSDGAGYGALDALRTLNQNVEHDFTLTALLLDVDEGGLGGLEARTIARAPDDPRFHLSVIRDGDGARLIAGVRAGDSAAEAAPLPVELPVYLRLQREGGVITGAWSPDGATWFEHLAFDTAATALAGTTLTAAAAQAAPGAAGPRTARFAEVNLQDFTPPPDAQCTSANVSPAGARITIAGLQLGQVQGARVAGERATVLRRTADRLLLQAPRPRAAVASGAVVLEAAEGETVVGGRVSFAGRPFVRGDLDENGVVDGRDARLLAQLLDGRLLAVSCEPAADVDGDGDIDRDDYARLTQFLRGSAAPPPAPYPAPGFARTPTLACGLGEPPIAEGLFDSNGRPIPVGATLREGDVVELRGQRLPTGPDASFYFGDVRAEALPFGTPRSATLRVGPVPTGGEKCPRLFESSDVDATPATRFGLLREVRPDTRARHLCPTFEPSRRLAGAARWDADRGELRVQVSRRVDATAGVQLDLLLARPAMTGGPDRGAREISVRARATDTRGGYQSLLTALAREVTLALDGGAPADDCRPCDFMATPDFGAGELVIRPCKSDMPPEPPPPPPPHENTLAPYVPPVVGGAGAVLHQQPSCESANAPLHSRLNAWCVYERSTRTGVGGLPNWEASIPQAVLFDGPNAPIGLPAPPDRTVGQKRTMFSTDAWHDALSGGYLSACAQAARVAYCQGGHQDWMPPFSPGARIYKGFWRPLEKLPASANPDDLYSYQPPSGPRQYLVGLHISSGTSNISTYWQWATFWYPRGNDTHSKDGQPLAQTYNAGCTTGDFADQPQEIKGVWRNYVMCINGEDGGTPCGNPWGPFDECAETSCRDCHIDFAIDFPGVTPLGELSTAWMLSLTRSGPVKDCYDTIMAGKAQGQTPYKNLTPPECQ